MGWNLRDPWQYKQWVRENKRRAAQMVDMPLEDWATGYTEDEINKILRQGQRYSRKYGGGGGTTTPAVPDWMSKPWQNYWQGPQGTYARWTQPSGNWPAWYAPTAQVEDQPHLAVINRLLPYMNPDDVSALASQLFIAGGGEAGPYASYRQGSPAEAWPPVPAAGGEAPAGTDTGGTYEETLASIDEILGAIGDETAKAWAQAVFDVYKDQTRSAGMRGSEEEAVLQARLEELLGTIPDSAQPYAAALQRLVMPTVRNPAREFYELPAALRSSPTNWGQRGYLTNPAWL